MANFGNVCTSTGAPNLTLMARNCQYTSSLPKYVSPISLYLTRLFVNLLFPGKVLYPPHGNINTVLLVVFSLVCSIVEDVTVYTHDRCCQGSLASDVELDLYDSLPDQDFRKIFSRARGREDRRYSLVSWVPNYKRGLDWFLGVSLNGNMPFVCMNLVMGMPYLFGVSHRSGPNPQPNFHWPLDWMLFDM